MVKTVTESEASLVEKIDPITFEILSHRIWAINDETAQTIRLVSGSPVANQVFDFNATLMTRNGDVFSIGSYIMAHAQPMQAIVKHVLENFGEDPGINEGDMFLCTDPYSGSAHQTCASLVSPIFWKGELVSWSGATIHVVDAGGPLEGQVQLGAQSIFGEQKSVPPIKIIEKGKLRKDIEAAYLSISRLPTLLGLDLRAKIASNNVARERILELIERYGLQTYLSVANGLMNLAESKLRQRLSELPDGTWSHRTYIDYDPGDGIQRIYKLKLSLRKKRDRMTFDFTETDPQAPAVINMTRPLLLGSITMAVLPYLCWDIPHAPSGIERVYDVISKKGTLVDCVWPAGCSKSTTSSCRAVSILAAVALGKMFAASEKYRERLMAASQGGINICDIFGKDQDGRYFGTVVLDAMAGGMGARSFKDGIDTGGNFDSFTAGMPNVETTEAQFPFLYLWRRQTCDSGGPGKYRGGVTVSWALKPHQGQISTLLMHCSGSEMPISVGILGAYPSCINQRNILRESNIEHMFRGGLMPADISEIRGKVESFPAIARTSLGPNDVLEIICMGGGGFGDPLERDPILVLDDIQRQLVSPVMARRVYGLVVKRGKVDYEATRRVRSAIKQRRRRNALRSLNVAKRRTKQ